MNRSAQDVLLMVFGAILLWVGLSDLHLTFVKPSMQPLIVGSAVVLLVLAGAGMVSQAMNSGSDSYIFSSPAGSAGHGHGHEHHHEHGAPRTSWLLALPLLVLLLISPPALGADAVKRGAARVPVAQETAFPPLPPLRDGAVDLSLADYGQRAAFGPETVQGTPVRLLGFATPDAQGWVLARVSMSCCAADGRAVTVRMTGAAARPVPAADTWWEVTGTLTPALPEDEGVPALEVTSLTPVDAPRSPYATLT